MNKLLALLAVTTCVAAVTPAMAADASMETKTMMKQSDDGSMKKETKSEATDTAGTTTKTDATVKTDVSSDGSKETTVTKESSTDPKGLGNKTSTKVEDKTKTDAKTGKTKHKHKKVVNGSTVENKTTETPGAMEATPAENNSMTK